MLANLPHDSENLKRLAVVKPSNMALDGAMRQMKELMNQWPCLIPAGSDADKVEAQLCRLQAAVLEKNLKADEDNIRLDKLWGMQATSDPDTRDACQFLLNCLVVPHSSAPCERVFSHVRKIKTDQRKLMGDKLLESLVVLKHIPTEALSRNHSEQ